MMIRCPDCKHKWETKSRLIQVICANCGYYNGREVVNVMAKELKKQEKIKAQQAK